MTLQRLKGEMGRIGVYAQVFFFNKSRRGTTRRVTSGEEKYTESEQTTTEYEKEMVGIRDISSDRTVLHE